MKTKNPTLFKKFLPIHILNIEKTPSKLNCHGSREKVISWIKLALKEYLWNELNETRVGLTSGSHGLKRQAFGWK